MGGYHSRTSRTNARGMLLVFTFLISAGVCADDCDFCASDPPEGTEFVSLLLCTVTIHETIQQDAGQYNFTEHSRECGSCTSKEPHEEEPTTWEVKVDSGRIICVDADTIIYTGDDDSIEIVAGDGGQQCAQFKGAKRTVTLQCQTEGCEKKKVHVGIGTKKDLATVDVLWTGAAYYRRTSDGTTYFAGCQKTDQVNAWHNYMIGSGNQKEERIACPLEESIKCDCNGVW